MPAPLLPLPTYPWTEAYDALVDVLREDPDLRRVVKVWRVWDGSPRDLDPLTTAHMPYVQLTPLPSPVSRATEADLVVPFKVRVNFATTGTNVRDLLNLWGAMMQALRWDRPFRTTTVGKHLRDHGTVNHRVSGLGVDPKIIGEDFTSDGAIEMLLHVPA